MHIASGARDRGVRPEAGVGDRLPHRGGGDFGGGGVAGLGRGYRAVPVFQRTFTQCEPIIK